MGLYDRINIEKKPECMLSILIPTLPERMELIGTLLEDLNKRSLRYQVQILYLGNNKWTSDFKRSKLIGMADGKYVTFIDDDDHLSDTYIDMLLTATRNNSKVITFKVQRHNGMIDYIQEASNEHGRTFYENAIKGMLLNHLCMWRRDMIKEFCDLSYYENDEVLCFHDYKTKVNGV